MSTSRSVFRRLCCCCLKSSGSSVPHRWGYALNNGPDTWAEAYPVANGRRQSPINIMPKEAEFDSTLKPLKLQYDPNDSKAILNNGHSFQVDFMDDINSSTLTGGPISGVYRLKQFHCHWGRNNDRGSEHTVNGISFPCELHLVHWNTKYPSFGDAVNKSDGLAVVGVFLTIGPANPRLQKILDCFDSIKNKGKQISFSSFDTQTLLPPSLEYWTYEGSLTTPPLLESVTWIVLEQVITVSPAQMEMFRNLQFCSEGDGQYDMVDNFRPPQPLKGRRVRASFPYVRSSNIFHGWGYALNNGPDTWAEAYPVANGRRQSPINIVPKEAEFDSTLRPLKLKYDPNDSKAILNNGHSFQVDFADDTNSSTLTGGPISGVYRLKQFHCHWGSSNDRGSEHTVNGMSFPCELHLVHWNTKYPSFGDAAKEPDGLAVVGVFLTIGPANPRLQKILDCFASIKNKGQQISFSSFDTQTLLPSLLEYWTYEGSLTTPPLLESVTWIVLRQVITVSPAQMEMFRNLQFCSEGEGQYDMVDNFRPPQPLKGRRLLANFKV